MPGNWGATLRGFGAVTDGLGALADSWSGRVEWVVGTNVEYSIFVEFGTSRMKAQPYIRPAIQSAKRNAQRLAAESDTLEEFVAKLALHIERVAKQRCPVDTGNLRASIRAEKLSGGGSATATAAI